MNKIFDEYSLMIQQNQYMDGDEMSSRNGSSLQDGALLLLNQRQMRSNMSESPLVGGETIIKSEIVSSSCSNKHHNESSAVAMMFSRYHTTSKLGVWN